MKNYELIEHTADIGIRIKAGSLEKLFAAVASAMFDIIAEDLNPKAAGTTKISIAQEGDNTEELLINWLNELLSLSAVKELIFCDFQISKLTKNEAPRDLSHRGLFERNTERLNCSSTPLKSNDYQPRTYKIEAVVTGKASKNFKFNVEIKAATYHQLKLEQNKSGWETEIIFDV